MNEKNKSILDTRQAAILARSEIGAGDFIRVDDVYLRVAYVWRDENNKAVHAQTTHERAGSYYMGDGYMSYSGSLDHGMPTVSLERTDELKAGRAWFFSDDWPKAHNGIDVVVDSHVWNYTP